MTRPEVCQLDLLERPRLPARCLRELRAVVDAALSSLLTEGAGRGGASGDAAAAGQQAEREQPNLFQPLLPPPPTLSATTRTKLVTLVGKLLTEIVFIPTDSPREARHDEDRA